MVPQDESLLQLKIRQNSQVIDKDKLVLTVLQLWSFFKKVEQNQILFYDGFFQYAAYRYEKFWLPLLKIYNKEVNSQGTQKKTLPAPLDIEWVWYIHTLNPIQYQKDCQELFGDTIEHQIYGQEQSNELTKVSQKTWYDLYPTVDFDIIEKQYINFETTPNFVPQIKYDLQKASKSQRSFISQVSLPHYGTQKFVAKAVDRYLIHLAIKSLNPSILVVPTYDIRLVWYAHKSCTSSYDKECLIVLKKRLDHDDQTLDRSYGLMLRQSTEETAQVWQKYAQEYSIPGGMYRGVIGEASQELLLEQRSIKDEINHQYANKERLSMSVKKYFLLKYHSNDIDLKNQYFFPNSMLIQPSTYDSCKCLVPTRQTQQTSFSISIEKDQKICQVCVLHSREIGESLIKVMDPKTSKIVACAQTISPDTFPINKLYNQDLKADSKVLGTFQNSNEVKSNLQNLAPFLNMQEGDRAIIVRKQFQDRFLILGRQKIDFIDTPTSKQSLQSTFMFEIYQTTGDCITQLKTRSILGYNNSLNKFIIYFENYQILCDQQALKFNIEYNKGCMLQQNVESPTLLITLCLAVSMLSVLCWPQSRTRISSQSLVFRDLEFTSKPLQSYYQLQSQHQLYLQALMGGRSCSVPSNTWFVQQRSNISKNYNKSYPISKPQDQSNCLQEMVSVTLGGLLMAGQGYGAWGCDVTGASGVCNSLGHDFKYYQNY